MIAKKNKNKVLLVVDASLLSTEILFHGLNLSKRMATSLEVLHLLGQESASKVAQDFKENMATLQPDEPVTYIQLVNHRGLTIETADYAKNRRNILCVALCLKGEGLPRKKGVRQKKFLEITKLLNCPVVLYTDSPANQLKTRKAESLEPKTRMPVSHLSLLGDSEKKKVLG
jgi:hypothetical protein